MRNLTMLTDFYQLTMMQAYFETERRTGREQRAVFDLYYRENPDGNGFVIAAGLQQAADYLETLRFTGADAAYLRSLNIFNEDFLAYLLTFRFTGDVAAVPEGTVVFPAEPLLRVTAPLMEAQLVETALLNIINHQSLIATKAARVVQAARGDAVLEFGLRRAQGPDAGLYGARAAVIGGCAATSDTMAGQLFDVPVRGTHAHSWIMSFGSELEAFRAYAALYPSSCVLLVDTYDTLKSGVPNAIKVFSEMRDSGARLDGCGIRLDSGDLAYLSKKARAMLDAAGFGSASISVSNELDERLIADMKVQGAAINVWGVGTRLITSKDCPALGGVYKMSAISENGGPWTPKMKLSENPSKMNNPGIKKVFRLYDAAAGKLKADLIALDDERLDNEKDLTIFDPLAVWKRMTLKAGAFTVRELLEPVFADGRRVHRPRPVMEIREYSLNERAALWDEHKRLINPHPVPVDLSQRLYDLKQGMLADIKNNY